MGDSCYRGIKIPNKVKIVENNCGQGYLVTADTQLDGAINWAESYSYSANKYKAKVYEYDNGKFTISLYDSADRSSQGGKLSFWNCTIHSPDGKDFIIGINADILFNLMMNSTIVNGDIQGNVWLGKEKNNTGVYTEDMEDFKQARKEDIIRETKKTNKYPSMSIVSTLKDKELYLGEFPYLFDVENLDSYSYNNSVTTLTIYNKKKKTCHLYCHLYEKYNDKGKYELSYIEIRKTKTSRLFDETLINSDIIHNYKDNAISVINESWKMYNLGECKDEWEKRSRSRANASHILQKYQIGLINDNKELDEQELIDLVYESSGHSWIKVKVKYE